MPSSGLGSETSYSSPDHFYVASYLSGLLVGLATGPGLSLSTESGADYHTIGLEIPLGEPGFLAFTEGSWHTMGNRSSLLESGDFLDFVSPSFAYGLGTYHTLMVVLQYSGIDIDGSLTGSKGIYKLIIENMGQSGGRPLVNIRSVL